MKFDDCRHLARRLMDEHGLHHWAFCIDVGPKTRLGECRYSSHEIGLTDWYVEKNEEPCILDTILHEIAHALTPGDAHGPNWKDKCLKIGCDPFQYKTRDRWPESCLVAPTFNYLGECPECKRLYGVDKIKDRFICDCRNLWDTDRTVVQFWPNPHASMKKVRDEADLRQEYIKTKSRRLSAIEKKLENL